MPATTYNISNAAFNVDVFFMSTKYSRKIDVVYHSDFRVYVRAQNTNGRMWRVMKLEDADCCISSRR